MQVLKCWSTQGATNFDAETRTSHDIAGGTQKVSQTPPSLSGEKGQRVKEGDDCNCCNSTDLSLGFHDHDRSLTRCSTTQNTRVTCYKGCFRLHPFYIDNPTFFSSTHKKVPPWALRLSSWRRLFQKFKPTSPKMGSLLAPPAKCGIIFIGILIGQVGLPAPSLCP